MGSRLSAVRLPIDWDRFGFPAAPDLDGVVLATGPTAWAWSGEAPEVGPPGFALAAPGEPAPGWVVDHVVLLVPDLEGAIGAMAEIGAHPRLRMEVRGRATSFFRVGTVLEVIETPVRAPKLYGVALATADDLGDVVRSWREAGIDVSDPRPAIQPGRQIFTVRDAGAGFAVMSGESPAAPRSVAEVEAEDL